MVGMPTVEGRATALGQLVRARRLALHLSMEEASKQAEMSRATWGDLERGTKTPQRGTLERVERVLKWPERSTTAYLQGGGEPQPVEEGSAPAPLIEITGTVPNSDRQFRILTTLAGREDLPLSPEERAELIRIALDVYRTHNSESDSDT